MEASLQRQVLGPGHLQRMLAELESSPEPGESLYVPPGAWPAESVGLLPPSWEPAIRQAAPVILHSETGAALFWGQQRLYVILPPFPVRQGGRHQEWNVAPLRSLLEHPYVIGVVLLRLGGYSIGVFRGTVLLASKTDSRYVKGRHKAGGWSQQRFARIREKQIQELLDEACAVTHTVFTPYEQQMDYCFLGGDRFALGSLVKGCLYLKHLATRTMKRRLRVADPKREALDRMPWEIWKTTVLTSSQI